MNTTTVPANWQALEADRSADAIELESVNHYLTLFYCSHPQLQNEIREYKTAQSYLETIAGDNDADATHLLLTLAKDQYRLVFGHSWEVRR